jgi:hypothetical protein
VAVETCDGACGHRSIAFALVFGTSFLASIHIPNRKPLGVVTDAYFALVAFGPFCTVAAIIVAAIVTEQWTRTFWCVTLTLLIVTPLWANLLFGSFMRMLWDSGL